MRVYGRLLKDDLALIPKADDLLVIAEHVEELGECRRIRGVWDKGVVLVRDGTTAAIVVPPAPQGAGANTGKLSIVTRSNLSSCVEVWYDSSIGLSKVASGNKVAVNSGLGVTTGNTGAEGMLTISYDVENVRVYLENRTGRSLEAVYSFTN